MKTALIILNYNDYDTTASYLNEVKGYAAYDGIVVVDNASTDGSYTRLIDLIYDWDLSGHIVVVKMPSNGGYAKGNNYGAQVAIEKFAPDVLFFSNPDVHYDEPIVKQLVEDLENNSQAAIVAALTKTGRSVWALPGFWGTMRQILLISFNLHKRALRKKIEKDNCLTEVGVVEGSFFAVRKECFDEVNGFDERTFLYLEENILSAKMKTHGYVVMADPTINYIHEHSKSIKKAYKNKVRAFKLFKPSFLTYLEYVGMNPVKRIIFEIVFAIGYVERAIYSIVVR